MFLIQGFVACIVALTSTAAGTSSPGIVLSLDAPPNIAACGCEVLKARPDLGLYLVRPPAGLSIEAACAVLAQVPGVRHAEADQRVVADGITLAFIDSHLRVDRKGAPADGGRSPSAGNQRFAGVRVALLDTGVDFNHPDLAGHLLPAGEDYVDHDLLPAEEQRAGDRDGDGYENEAYGHGTHAAGLLVGVGGARILPMRVLDPEGNGSLFDVLQAMHDARRGGAEIYQLSLSAAQDSPALREAVELAQASGGLVIASAGNVGDRSPRYPAAYPGVLAVTATDASGVLLSTSSFGAHVGLSIAGEKVLSAYPEGRQARWTGTSMAASLVAAAAAASWHGAEDTVRTLVARAEPVDDYNPGKEGELGAGLLRVANPYGD